MKKARYVRVDVFAKHPFGGNPLAVFPDGRNLTAREMQLITREMNLSETTFVFPPSKGSGADFMVRIFVPDKEIPYAGHPTIGTFYVLAREGKIRLKDGVTTVKMEVKAGVMPVEIHSKRGKIEKVVTVQNKPEFGEVFEDVSPFAKALSLDEDDFDSRKMPVQLVSTGLPWAICPVRSRDAVERATGNATAFQVLAKILPKDVLDLYVTCLKPIEASSTTHSRGLSLVGKNIVEDPATGSASGCLGAYLVHHCLVPSKRSVRIINEQGYEIDRPSKVEIVVGSSAAGDIDSVRVGGSTVHVMDGVVYL
jgi:trans-2,3-dihydro-3-hydroxyanthranilate isomerase